jgi:hypothetical protein
MRHGFGTGPDASRCSAGNGGNSIYNEAMVRVGAFPPQRRVVHELMGETRRERLRRGEEQCSGRQLEDAARWAR